MDGGRWAVDSGPCPALGLRLRDSSPFFDFASVESKLVKKACYAGVDSKGVSWRSLIGVDSKGVISIGRQSLRGAGLAVRRSLHDSIVGIRDKLSARRAWRHVAGLKRDEREGGLTSEFFDIDAARIKQGCD